ncbi:MAG: hypothetical protein QOE93_2537 [Actinomycetota bacterium]|nr:hypothetical protein [Actinomycetota bacterium]
MDDAVRAYVDAIAPEHRPLFDRIQRLVLEVRPDAELILSYKIPTFVAGRFRLYVGVWKRWVSLYGWGDEDGAAFTTRHPELTSGKGTIRLPPDAAADLPDDELRDLVRAALGG